MAETKPGVIQRDRSGREFFTLPNGTQITEPGWASSNSSAWTKFKNAILSNPSVVPVGGDIAAWVGNVANAEKLTGSIIRSTDADVKEDLDVTDPNTGGPTDVSSPPIDPDAVNPSIDPPVVAPPGPEPPGPVDEPDSPDPDSTIVQDLLKLFGQQPAYKIPKEVFSIMNEHYQTASALQKLFEDNLVNIMGEDGVIKSREKDTLAEIEKGFKGPDGVFDLLKQDRVAIMAELRKAGISNVSEAAQMADPVSSPIFQQLEGGYTSALTALATSRQEQLDAISGPEGGATQALTTLQEGRAEQLGIYDGPQGAESVALNAIRDQTALGIGTLQGSEQVQLDLIKTGTDTAVNQLLGSKKDQLSEVTGYSDKALASIRKESGMAIDALTGKAYGRMPGEQLFKDQMASNTAGAVQAIQERAGGGGSALGALADVFSGQADQTRQLAMQKAMFRSAAISELAGARERFGAAQAGVQERLGVARADITDRTDQSIADYGFKSGVEQAGVAGRTSSQVASMQQMQGISEADIVERIASQRSNIMGNADRAMAGIQMQAGIASADVMGRSDTESARMMANQGRDMADAYRMTGQDLRNARNDFAGSIADATIQTGQMMSQAQQNQIMQQSNTRMQTTGLLANAQMQGTKDLGWAMSEGAQLRGDANAMMASYKDKQWETNELSPFVNKRNFIVDEYRRTDPWNAAMDFTGDQADKAWNQKMASYFQQ